MSKPITLYSHATGPNPWKVAIILEELNIPYTNKFIKMADMKKPPFEALNPNGRVPAIEDPNTGITLWESGAIIEYLVQTYDTKAALTYTSSPERFYVSQWLHFQMSGQGPYFGQAVWFSKFHEERIPSATKRYLDHVKRVLYVLNNALEGKQWLVGDKCTIADLSFVTWDMMLPFIFGDDLGSLELEKNYPNYFAWNKRLMDRPAVKKIAKEKTEAAATHE
ncbi:Glutathione S-transferase-like protein [Lachnellula willkommii]|uniref:Glutathione S-transferase-like protein n=1 Tax=Lachnellula willkommii TaxID=215461 RepID=A0A559M6L9_9HELO|nr:Glutathione S-transferase-like protein [Lachnellula willkommii]